VDDEHRAYYEARAKEYDDWWIGRGLFASRDSLWPARTLDLACGTGFLTRHLRGLVVGLDQSPAMIALAQRRLPDGVALVGDALDPPFADRAFERVVSSHFYGHLLEDDRARFLAAARRLGNELVVVDSAGEPRDEWQVRTLNDGSRHRVYKRFFDGPGLAAELGGGEVLHAGRWFVVVRS
jgi:SAM-dependent methyltransferase